MNREHLISELKNYTAFDTREEEMRKRYLMFVENNVDCFKRELLIGHCTGSCWVLNQDRTKVLLIHHAKLNKWLQPGGHCDGKEDVYSVAKKELEEETGLKPISENRTLFDLDIHKIPERKGVPEHEHFDLRFVFIVDENQPLQHNHETNDMKWLAISDLETFTKEQSVTRMRDKTIQ